MAAHKIHNLFPKASIKASCHVLIQLRTTPGALALWTRILQQLCKLSCPYCFLFCMLVGGDSPASVRCLVGLQAAISQRLQT